MKRDMELIRRILLYVEDQPSAWAPDQIKLEGYSDEQIGYHAYLLHDAGLVRGTDVDISDSIGPECHILNLTWAGHEFCDAARDDTRWKKAMSVVAEKGGAITIGVLQGLLVALMKNAFGLQ